MAVKSCRAHLHSNAWGVFPLPGSEDVKGKRIEKILHKGYDPVMLTVLPVPTSDDWGRKVYVRHVFGAQEGWTHVGMPHMCCMEVRVILEGSESILGFPYDEIPGSSAKEKRVWLASASADELHERNTRGFCITYDQTEAAVIPSGYMCVHVAHKTTFGLRWSISSDQQDSTRVKRLLRELLAAFRELSQPSTGHTGFLSFLDCDLS